MATVDHQVRQDPPHGLSDQFAGDEAASAELAAQLPTATEPVTAGSVDAILVTTSLRISLGTQRRVQAYAETHGVKPVLPGALSHAGRRSPRRTTRPAG